MKEQTIKAAALRLLQAATPLVETAVKWLQANIDFAFILAAITETPRWTMTFRALHESPLIGVPMGVLLAFATARAWRKYFENPRNWWLLGFNAAAMVVAVLVISPVLYALTKSDAVDLSVTLANHPNLLIAWACMVAVSTFLPLVQLAAVTDAPAMQSCKPRTKTVQAITPVYEDAVPIEQPASNVFPEFDPNVHVTDDASSVADGVLHVDKRKLARMMRDGEGLSDAQIAAQLQVHPTTVGRWLKKENMQ